MRGILDCNGRLRHRPLSYGIDPDMVCRNDTAPD